jgi:flagellar assembly protein FliH
MFEPVVRAVRVVDAKPPSFDFRPFANTASPDAAPVELHDQAWDEGYQYGRAEMAADRVALLALIASAEALRPEPSEEIAALIAETVLRLVSEIVGDVAVDRDALIRRAMSSAALISDADAARTMWVHPSDMDLLSECNLTLNIMADPAADLGSIRIDCSAGWIEHGTPLYLDALRSGLGLTENAS